MKKYCHRLRQVGVLLGRIYHAGYKYDRLLFPPIQATWVRGVLPLQSETLKT